MFVRSLIRSQFLSLHLPKQVSRTGQVQTLGGWFSQQGDECRTRSFFDPNVDVFESFSTAASSGDESPSRVALVQGASRGLGLEFTRQLLQTPTNRVVATCRDPPNAKDLAELKAMHPDRLDIVPMDVTNEESIEEAAKKVSSVHDRLDLLLNVAGILHIPGEMSPETALARVEAKFLLTNYKINAMGPILVSKAFAPLLVKAGKASKAKPAVIASVSAKVGSIGDNAMGGWYSYRASKTALNQLTKTMSLEFGRRRQNVACIVMHPGTVDTDLSKPFQKNVKPEKLFSRERAIEQLLSIVDGLTMEETGKFYSWDGTELPW